jgi:hypothetical protein
MNKNENTRRAFEKFAEEHGIDFQNGENEFSYFDLQTAFEAGMEYGTKFAKRWISVKKELPEPGTPCLVRTKSGHYAIGNRKYLLEGLPDWKWGTGSDIYDMFVTHWRPIELK